MASEPLFLRERIKTMAKSEDNMNLGQLFDLIQKILGDHPILKEMYGKVMEEQSRMGKVNIP